MIEVAKEEELSLTFSPNTSFWGDNSKIYFSYPSDKVTIYCYKANGSKVTCSSNGSSGTAILKKDIGRFVVVATKPSTNWNDISITVTGIPVSGGEHPPCESDPLKLTAYRIKIEVQEKPWGGNWGPPTAGAADPSIPRNPWYHLWRVNENAIRANVEPQCLADIVADTVFEEPNSLETENFGTGESPDSNAQPPWKKITAGVGAYTVTATIITGYDDQLTGTMTPVDIVINDIESVKWAEQGEPNSPNLVAKLEPHDGAFRAFPEKATPNSPNYNIVVVLITLAIKPPDYMQGIKVYTAWFDPNNPKGSTKTHNPDGSIISPSNIPNTANTVRDNHGKINMSNNTVTFGANGKVGAKGFTITSAYAGDNYIVAVHPNEGTVNAYRFKDDGKTLERPDGNDWKDLKKELQTKILTVWRTLWLELDSMMPPVIQTTVGDPNPHGFGISTRAVYDANDNVTRGNWDISTNIPAEFKEPNDFDVVYVDDNGEPISLAIPDVSLLIMPPGSPLTPIFLAACIDVKEIEQSDDDASWIYNDGNSWTHGAWDTKTAFKRELGIFATDEYTTISEQCRDVVMPNEPTFWCVHGIGAYKEREDRSWDGTNAPGCDDVPGDDAWVLGGALQNGTGIFLIFNETIRDAVSTDARVKRSLEDTHQLVTLHEVLHLFGFADDDPAGGVIMTNGWIFAVQLPPAVLTLSNAQIQKIQERGCPR